MYIKMNKRNKNKIIDIYNYKKNQSTAMIIYHNIHLNHMLFQKIIHTLKVKKMNNPPFTLK